MNAATQVILVAAALGFLYRLLNGPTLTDRVNAIGGLIIAGMGAIATNAAHTGTGAFLPVLVAVALVGPISNGMTARYIESRAEDRPSESRESGVLTEGEAGDKAGAYDPHEEGPVTDSEGKVGDRGEGDDAATEAGP